MLISRQFESITRFSLVFGLVSILGTRASSNARCEDAILNCLEAEENGRLYLQTLDRQGSDVCFREKVAEWRFATDLTDRNEKLKLEQNLISARFYKEAWKNVTQFDWKRFKDEDLRRQFKFYSVPGVVALPEPKYIEYVKIVDEMEKIYSTTKICSYTDRTNCTLSLEPEIKEIMRKSRNPDELGWLWQQWHDRSGRKMRNHFSRYVQLSNEVARLNNFSDTAAFWLHEYETKHFRTQIEQLWGTLKPFYMQLHTYVRSRLRALYGEDIVPRNKPIPVHLLGNMWAQTWNNILDVTVPYPGKASVDVTAEMKRQGYTPKKMFQISDRFFTDLGLSSMPPEFWNGSVIEKLRGREMVCHASAWDFCNGKDFRIKQCTRVTMEDLITVHHEMGHVQYFLQYRHLPRIYRNGANPGFHEAVGDTLALSVQTPKHLKAIGLLDPTAEEDEEMTINFLYSMALEKLAFFPFAYVVDKWRWDVFEGKISSSDYNGHWWKLRELHQGMTPPVQRSEEHFDPGAKYHVAAGVEYIRYFVSGIIQFQFHKALCLVANQYDPEDPLKPLHKCDIDQSKEAGAKLAAMLSMGSSKPWPYAMKVITGQEKMDAGPLLEYFKPLEQWLKATNEELDESIGWEL